MESFCNTFSLYGSFWKLLFDDLQLVSQTPFKNRSSPRKEAPTITTFLLVANFTTRFASSGVRMLKTFSTSLPLQLRALGLETQMEGYLGWDPTDTLT